MTITVTTPTNVQPSTTYTISGGLSGYSKAPSLTYIDDPVVPSVTGLNATPGRNQVALAWTAVTPLAWKTLPTGASVTTTAYSFTHPAIAAGSHTTVVADGTTNGTTAAYTVAAPPPAVTHTTVIAKLNQLKTEIDGIIADVNKLTP